MNIKEALQILHEKFGVKWKNDSWSNIYAVYNVENLCIIFSYSSNKYWDMTNDASREITEKQVHQLIKLLKFK